MSSVDDMALLTKPHNYWNNPPSNAWQVSVADFVGLTVATILVLARCYTKWGILKRSGWEDYTSIGSLVSLVGFTIANSIQRWRYGGGRHTWDLPPEYYNGYLRTGQVHTYTYLLGIVLAKLSLLLYLYRIFRVDMKFRIATWLIGITVTVWTFVTLMLCLFSCKPVRATWEVALLLDPKTKCNPKIYNTIWVQGFCNISTDFALLILPIPTVWRLQMDLTKKLGVFAVFATGSGVCVIAIIRQYIVYVTPKAGDNWIMTKNIYIMSVEFSLSLIVACLPALAPFFKHVSFPSSLLPSSLRSKKSSHGSAMQRAPWPQKLRGPNHDIERGALRDTRDDPSAWHVPHAWKETEKRSFDTYDGSEGSQETAQAMYHTASRQGSRDHGCGIAK